MLLLALVGTCIVRFLFVICDNVSATELLPTPLVIVACFCPSCYYCYKIFLLATCVLRNSALAWRDFRIVETYAPSGTIATSSSSCCYSSTLLLKGALLLLLLFVYFCPFIVFAACAVLICLLLCIIPYLCSVDSLECAKLSVGVGVGVGVAPVLPVVVLVFVIC